MFRLWFNSLTASTTLAFIFPNKLCLLWKPVSNDYLLSVNGLFVLSRAVKDGLFLCNGLKPTRSATIRSSTTIGT